MDEACSRHRREAKAKKKKKGWKGAISKREGDNIKVKLSEMACESAKLVYLPHDSDWWRVIGRTVMR